MKNFFKTLSVTSIIFSGSVFGLNSSPVVADIQHSKIKEFSGIYKKDYSQTAAQYATEAAKDIQYKEAQDILDRAIKELLEIWSNKMATDIVKRVLNTVFVERKLFNQDDPSETIDFSDDPALSLLFPTQSSSPKLEDIKTVPAAELIEKQIEIWSGYRQKQAIYYGSKPFLKYYEASNALLASVKERTKTPAQKTEDEIRKSFAARYKEIANKYLQDRAAPWNKFKPILEPLAKKNKERRRAYKQAEKELNEALKEVEKIAKTSNATEEEKKNVKEKYNNAKEKRDKCYNDWLPAKAELEEAQKAYNAELTEPENAYDEAKEKIDKQLQQELDKLKKNQK